MIVRDGFRTRRMAIFTLAGVVVCGSRRNPDGTQERQMVLANSWMKRRSFLIVSSSMKRRGVRFGRGMRGDMVITAISSMRKSNWRSIRRYCLRLHRHLLTDHQLGGMITARAEAGGNISLVISVVWRRWNGAWGSWRSAYSSGNGCYEQRVLAGHLT